MNIFCLNINIINIGLITYFTSSECSPDCSHSGSNLLVTDRTCADEFKIIKAFSLCNFVAIRLFQ